jgi:type II protein arginine methyltransferase
MRNLQTRQPPPSLIERFGAGYQDYLQAPLQPLTVNLESVTYEVFEKDPIKYDWYERAIARALSDWIAQRKPASGTDGRIVVAVVGAGRGPLVTRALKAAESVGIDIDMWALEKNPNAFVLLQRHNSTVWNGRVSLVKSDMRTWRGPVRHDDVRRLSQSLIKTQKDPSYTGSADTDSTYLLATAATKATHYKIDILVSELLGSFADNELSPECLDGVQHLLNPTHGISIPTSYTAFISPIAAPKLYADINNSMAQTTPHAAEIPYVVMLNAIDHISSSVDASSPWQAIAGDTNSSTPTSRAQHPPSSPTPISPLSSHPLNIPNPTPYSRAHTTGKAPAPNRPQRSSSTQLPSPPTPVILPTWSFSHPNTSIATSSPPSANQHNTRHSILHFPIPHRAACHGLAGYFECVLYSSTPVPTMSSASSAYTPEEDYRTASAVVLSTNPNSMPQLSPDMMSWFPLYFPLKRAVWFPDDSECVINIWRKEDGRKVWYEWIVEAFISVDAGRGRGKKRVKVGGSEVHSSAEEGCLM